MTTYTDAQIDDQCALLKHREQSAESFRVTHVEFRMLHDMLRSLLTERQAGSAGDGIAWSAVSKHRDALTDIAEFAHDRSSGPAVPDALWEVRAMAYDALDELPASLQPPQPPTKGSVRGVSDADVSAAMQAYIDESGIEHSQRGDYLPIDDDAMRAALESFANRGDGDE